MAKKKIVFVIVEGPSDDEALGILFSRIYDKDKVDIICEGAEEFAYLDRLKKLGVWR